jgi:hypothetical protein
LDDTVSEEEYGSSVDDESINNYKKHGDKDSKYSHSRFSSQIQDELDEFAAMGDLSD